MEILSTIIGGLQQLGAIILLTLSAIVNTTLPHTVVVSPSPILEDRQASTTPDVFPIATSSQTTASTAPVAPKKTQALKTVTTQPKATQAEEPAQTSPNFDVNAQTRNSLVNVLCTTQAGGYSYPISGSGIIIDSRGIILTNAHVAQFFLLKDYIVKNNVQCVVRVGSPAQPRYTAQLIYISPEWVRANASKILSSEPTGTGQNDFAFLRITGTTDPQGTLPSSFPALPMDSSAPDVGEKMLLASYPAGFISGMTIEMNLYQSSAFTTVGKLYTFDDTTHVDVFSISGTIVSQAGSSGGAVVHANNGAVGGIIVTASASSTTSGRELNAITLAHIDRSLAADGKGGIAALLTGDIAKKAADFNETTAPDLTAQLSAILKKTLP